MTTARGAIYTRISADRPANALGVTRQLDDCLALADRLDWQIAHRFDDNDISAFNGKHRPGFEALLDAMKTGQIDALICWHTDRLYRSMRDLERLIEIAEANRVQIRTVQSGELDLSTSAGRMMARILGSVARRGRANARERAESHRRNGRQLTAASANDDREPLRATPAPPSQTCWRQEHPGRSKRNEGGGSQNQLAGRTPQQR